MFNSTNEQMSGSSHLRCVCKRVVMNGRCVIECYTNTHLASTCYTKPTQHPSYLNIPETGASINP